MTAQKPAEYKERKEKVPPFAIHVVSYRLGERWHCVVDNVDPGAVVARAQGATREEAEGEAVGKAREFVAKTRVFK